MAIFHYVVLTSAAPGRLSEFEQWYDNQHLQDVVAVPGIKSARRYRLLNSIADEVGPSLRWATATITKNDRRSPEGGPTGGGGGQGQQGSSRPVANEDPGGSYDHGHGDEEPF